MPLLLAALFCLGTHSTVFGPINTRCCRSTCATTSWWRATRSSRRERFSRFCSARSSAAASSSLANGALIVGGCRRRRRRSPAGWRRARFPRRRRIRGRCAAAAAAARLDRRGRPRDDAAGAAAADSRDLVVLALRRHRRRRDCRCLPRTCSFANEHVVTLMLALFAVGIGARIVLAERLLHGEVSARYVPVAAARDGGLRLRSASRERRPRRAAPSSRPSRVFLRSPASWRDRSATSSAWRSPAGCSACRSTRCCSTRASRHTARA